MSTAGNYDLTSVIVPFMDRHMVLPLLEFMEDQKLYPEKEISAAKVQLVSKTSMIDFAADEHKKLYGTPLPGVDESRTKVMEKFNELKKATANVIKVATETDPELLHEKFGIDFAKLGITVEEVELLQQWGKINFDIGKYGDAATHLEQYMMLSKNEERCFQALWGKLAAEILMVQWTPASEDLTKLKEAIDLRIKTDHVVQLQQRTWLIHWSLFIFFNLPDGRRHMLEFLLQEKLTNAIQTNCPHILRYMAAAAICSKMSRSNAVRDVVRMLRAEEDNYSDPVTKFLVCVSHAFDFERARELLKECTKVFQQDFFLHGCSEEFEAAARRLLFETLCRTHERIDLGVVAEIIDLKQSDEIGSGIVAFVQQSNVNGKIDTNNNQLVMARQPNSVCQDVIERTKGLSFRSAQLFQSIDRAHAAN